MISVCIATYNGARYIEAQIRSILPQLAQEDEIIISDDGSTDDTLRCIQQIADDRIHVVSRLQPIGVTANFYAAMEKAKGDVIFLCDQDDVWLPNKVQRCMEGLKQYDMIVCDAQVVNADLQPLYPSLFALIHSRSGLWHNWAFCSFYGSGMAFRRSVWENAHPLPSGSLIAHDWWLGIVAEMTGKVCFLPETLYLYRRHTNTVTQVNNRSLFTRSQRPWYIKITARIQMLYYIILYRLTHRKP